MEAIWTIFHALLNRLLSNPSKISRLPQLPAPGNVGYYRTTNGAETDFVINIDGKVYAIECKVSFSPTLSKGNYLAFEDIAPKHTFVVTPSTDSWPLKSGIDVVSLGELGRRLGGFK
jgi:predicted AAA+ superfamily ATPase